MRFTAQELAAATGGLVRVPGPAGAICTDTRRLQAGEWYLALAGDRFDGHDFCDQAARSEAAGCVVHKEAPPGWLGGVVRVSDTTRALQALGRHARDQVQGQVVALTGSSGKTTTRSMLGAALAGQLDVVHQTVGNLNNHLGVPMTLVASPRDAEALVVELGTSSPGEIGFLSEIVRPDVRLIVNVGPAHLEELGGLPGVALEKGALFATARPGDLLVVNVDDPYVRDIPRPLGTRHVTFGSGLGADVQLLDAEVDAESLVTRARFATPSGVYAAALAAPGRHVALDAAAALAAVVAMGLAPCQAVAELERWRPVGMRMARVELPSGAVILNDAYNANPASVEAGLVALAALPGRRVAVLGDMLELGPGEAGYHRNVARRAGELGLDLVVLVGPRMASAAVACVGAGEVWADSDPLAVVERLRAVLGPDDTVLLKASRGARVERILHSLQAEAPCSTT